jgi:hypothetical protein
MLVSIQDKYNLEYVSWNFQDASFINTYFQNINVLVYIVS